MNETTGSSAGTPCVAYAAKSTTDPRGSIPTQHADIRAAIEREAGGRFLYGEAQSDEARSAFTANRGPGLAEAKRLVLDARPWLGALSVAADGGIYSRVGQRLRWLRIRKSSIRRRIRPSTRAPIATASLNSERGSRARSWRPRVSRA